ncbi:MAG TPA: hypothetical protein VFR58_10890 [Flavisolibacter sp.]|nr:hypothetical protein [Flavisolibacter sp.]
MYFIYVDTDAKVFETLEAVMHRVDKTKLLIAVANGYELLQFLQNVKWGQSYPDLIILNMIRPEALNGMELLQLLKTDDIYRLIPVIMLLPQNNEEHQSFCRSLGADTILLPTEQKDWVSAARQICSACS